MSQKYHFMFSFDSALCKCILNYLQELNYVTPAAFRHNFWSTGNKSPQCICVQNLKFVDESVPRKWRGRCQKFEMMTGCPWVPVTFEPKINRLRLTVEGYYCAKFQVIPIRGCHFIVLTYTTTHTHTHTSWQSDRYIRAADAINVLSVITWLVEKKIYSVAYSSCSCVSFAFARQQSPTIYTVGDTPHLSILL